MNRTAEEDQPTQTYEKRETNFQWKHLPTDEQERIRQEIVEGLQESIEFEAMMQEAVQAEMKGILEEREIEDLIQQLLEEADNESIAKCIPEQVVEECVDEHMSTSSATSDTVKKAQRETLISIFRAVTAVGVAVGSLITLSFVIAGGYPLAGVALLMTAFCVYAFRYNFEEL